MAAVARIVEREKRGTGNGRGRSVHCAWRWRCKLYPMRDSVESSGWASTASSIGVGTGSGGRAVYRMRHAYVSESVWAMPSRLRRALYGLWRQKALSENKHIGDKRVGHCRSRKRMAGTNRRRGPHGRGREPGASAAVAETELGIHVRTGAGVHVELNLIGLNVGD
jgi:hypothetical protein